MVWLCIVIVEHVLVFMLYALQYYFGGYYGRYVAHVCGSVKFCMRGKFDCL